MSIQSNQLRICSSCAGDINAGDTYSHDPDGDVVCADCTPAELEPELDAADAYGEHQYRALGPYGLHSNHAFDDEWDDYTDDLAYEDAW